MNLVISVARSPPPVVGPSCRIPSRLVPVAGSRLVPAVEPRTPCCHQMGRHLPVGCSPPGTPRSCRRKRSGSQRTVWPTSGNGEQCCRLAGWYGVLLYPRKCGGACGYGACYSCAGGGSLAGRGRGDTGMSPAPLAAKKSSIGMSTNGTPISGRKATQAAPVAVPQQQQANTYEVFANRLLSSVNTFAGSNSRTLGFGNKQRLGSAWRNTICHAEKGDRPGQTTRFPSRRSDRLSG
jgi:hypothetical protein